MAGAARRGGCLDRGAHPARARKKLTDVARALAGATRGPDTQAADLAAFGIALDGPAQRDPDIEVWPDNLETVDVFVALDTQWQIHGFSGARLGLRYEAIPVCLELMGVTDRAGVFEGLRTMERAALEVFMQQSAERQKMMIRQRAASR